MAYTLRGDVPDGLGFHADRGTQFTSEQVWDLWHQLKKMRNLSNVLERASKMRWLSHSGRL